MALEVPLITKQVVHHHGLKLSDTYEVSQLVYLLIPQSNLETEIVLACSFCIVFTCLYGLAYRWVIHMNVHVYICIMHFLSCWCLSQVCHKYYVYDISLRILMWNLIAITSGHVLQQGFTCLHFKETLESCDIVIYLVHNGAPVDAPSKVDRHCVVP